MRYAPYLYALLTASLACHAPPAGTGVTPRGDSRTISAEELGSATQLNLYDYIQANHPRWLVSVGGATSFPIAVFMNEAALGGVETLRTMGIAGIRSVRYYDASAAQSRFNRVNMGPVIQVVTQ